MKKDYLYFLIFISVAILAILIIVYFLKEKDLSIPPETENSASEYSVDKIKYNFWGFVKTKENDVVSVEGIISEPGKGEVEQPILTIKFKITPSTKIVKEGKRPIFVTPEDIQINDHLALKADKIDIEKKESTATNILILESVPYFSFPTEKSNSTKKSIK